MRTIPPKRREPKKTVSIEVRVSEEEKHAFLEACRAANRSASSVLRRLMGLFVAFQNLRPRTFKMMDMIFRPVRATLATIAFAAVISVTLLQTPSAAAEGGLAYHVMIEDAGGRIVSQGLAEVTPEGGAPVRDTLGEGVRFEIKAQPCTESTVQGCSEDDAQILLTIWDHGGMITDNGIVVRPQGEARFAATLSDGRALTAVFAQRTQG